MRGFSENSHPCINIYFFIDGSWIYVYGVMRGMNGGPMEGSEESLVLLRGRERYRNDREKEQADESRDVWSTHVPRAAVGISPHSLPHIARPMALWGWLLYTECKHSLSLVSLLPSTGSICINY